MAKHDSDFLLVALRTQDALVRLALSGAIEDAYQLFNLPFAFFLITGSNRISDAVAHVILEHETLHARQRSTRGLNLGDDVDAIAVVVNHAHQATHLPLDTGKPCTRALPGFWCHGLTIP